MYCKHCGKEIDDDAKFCKYCGGEQEATSETTKSPKKVIVLPTIKTNLSDKAKKWWGIYAIWAVLNFICIFLGKSSSASNHLFPFDRDEIRYYDFSEFLIYAILLPAVVLAIYKWRKVKKQNNQNI